MNSCDKQQLKITAAKVRLESSKAFTTPNPAIRAVPFPLRIFSPISISKNCTLTRRTRRIRTETVLSFPKATAHRVFTLHWHSAAISLWMS